MLNHHFFDHAGPLPQPLGIITSSNIIPPYPPLAFRMFAEIKAPLLASLLLRTPPPPPPLLLECLQRLRHPLLNHHFFDHAGPLPQPLGIITSSNIIPPYPPLAFRMFAEIKAPLLASLLLRTPPPPPPLLLECLQRLRHPLLKHHLFEHHGKAPFVETSITGTSWGGLPPPPPTPPLDFRIFPENKAPLLASFLLRTLRHPLLKHHFFDHRGKALLKHHFFEHHGGGCRPSGPVRPPGLSGLSSGPPGLGRIFFILFFVFIIKQTKQKTY